MKPDQSLRDQVDSKFEIAWGSFLPPPRETGQVEEQVSRISETNGHLAEPIAANATLLVSTAVGLPNLDQGRAIL